MTQAIDTMRAALAPTGRPSPLVADAVAKLAEQARQHPDPIDVREADTARCVYCPAPAATIRTGQQGNRFGLCTDCAPLHRKWSGGTTPLTEAETTLVSDDGLGAHRTTPIETEAREIDEAHPELPWLAAEIVVSDYRSQAYGRRTQVWLHNNRDTAELTVDQARLYLKEGRGWFDRLEALIDHAETVAASDFEGDPEIAAADREAEDRRIRAIDEARLARVAELLAEGRA